jgi:hypothetical protein
MYLNDTLSNLILPLIAGSVYVPSITLIGSARVSFNYLTSIKVSLKDRYIEPKKNKGCKNCIMRV